MKLHSIAVLLVAAFVVSACTGQGRFGGGGLNGGVDQSAISDPTSPAYFQQTIGDRILFAVNEHTLTPETEIVLQQQATWLIANPEYTAVVEGHADEQGTTAYNVALSARRANSVIEYLIGAGVEEGRLRSLPLGKARPIAICSNESCYQQNRRAVTVLTAGGVS